MNRKFAYIYKERHTHNIDMPDIIYAAEIGSNSTIKRAMALGENVNLQEPETGITPLHAAIANGHEHTVSLLLSYDEIDLDVRDRFGRTPAGLALTLGRNDIIELLCNHQLDGLGQPPPPSL